MNSVISQCDDFLSPDICNQIIAIADEQGWEKAGLLGEQREGYRIADSMWLRNTDGRFTELKQSVASLTETPIENQEDMHITRYPVGGQYKEHMDYFHKGTEYYENAIKLGGQRDKSVLIYLNDNFSGGETYFPVLGIKIQPKTGRLIVWNNLNEDGEPNPDTIHAGLIVESGIKYLLSIWIRERSRL